MKNKEKFLSLSIIETINHVKRQVEQITAHAEETQ